MALEEDRHVLEEVVSKDHRLLVLEEEDQHVQEQDVEDLVQERDLE